MVVVAEDAECCTVCVTFEEGVVGVDEDAAICDV